jgi:hypothetical protein
VWLKSHANAEHEVLRVFKIAYAIANIQEKMLGDKCFQR